MFTHIFDQYLSVYEPSDDTFLLCDAIKIDIDHLSALKPTILWELGYLFLRKAKRIQFCLNDGLCFYIISTGSGCVITFISQLLKPSALYLATDINPAALTLATRTAAHNAVSVFYYYLFFFHLPSLRVAIFFLLHMHMCLISINLATYRSSSYGSRLCIYVGRESRCAHFQSTLRSY